VSTVYSNDRIQLTPVRAEAFYGRLTVANQMGFAMNLSNHAAVASEVCTAKALLLPCHMPDLANFTSPIDTPDNPDNYFSRLLVSKEWIALNAPNICTHDGSNQGPAVCADAFRPVIVVEGALDVMPLQVSEDGKCATRELMAHMKVDEDEWHLSPDEQTNEHSMKDVEYDFPILDPKDIFARQRHLDKMRRREEPGSMHPRVGR
jgi:hypothetical protein